MHILKTIFTVFPLVALICLGSCSLIDPEGDEGCESGYSRSKFVGNAYLDSGFRVWTNPPSQNVRFINSNGGAFTFSVNVQNGRMEKELLNVIYGQTACEADTELFAWVERDQITYTSPEVPFDLDLRRFMYFNNDEFIKHQDTLVDKKESVIFSVGSSWSKNYLTDTVGVYFDQYKLLDSMYNGVYVFVYKYTDIEQVLYPTKFFLQKGSGLIGFELSNKEVWALK